MERKNITVDKIMEICEGELISRGKESTINSFCADTRKINVGDIFISLKSEKGLEMQYIKEALQKGARGCITEQDIPTEIIENYKDRIIIKVKDIIYAIQKLAIYKRKMYDIPVIAITGSVGKTSTKDIIANVLKQKFDVAKTEGNYNNHIGVPITILNWRENTNAAVVEMGMNHEGEISVLTNIAKPTIAVITNIGTAHIGFLGSRENILKAKLEILEGLTKNGKIIINNDNDMLSNCKTGEYKKITYGIKNKSNYTAYDINRLDYGSNYKIKIDDKEEEIMVPISGDHFIYNSLCAIAVGRETGIEINKIIEGIRTFSITGERNETKKVNDENLQLELANKVIAEELSVRATEALAKKICEDNIKEVPKKSKEKDVFIVDVEEKLRNIFGTKVNISKGKKKGKIEIEYYNEDDLNNIVSMLLEDN